MALVSNSFLLLLVRHLFLVAWHSLLLVRHLFLVAWHFVTTSKALVTSSDALVPSLALFLWCGVLDSWTIAV